MAKKSLMIGSIPRWLLFGSLSNLDGSTQWKTKLSVVGMADRNSLQNALCLAPKQAIIWYYDADNQEEYKFRITF